MPKLPSELNQPMRQGYRFAYGEGRRLSQEDAGPPRVGPKLSLVADEIDLVLDLDRSERARWDRFYRQDIRLGKDPFLMPDPEMDGWPLLVAGVPLTRRGAPILIRRTLIVQIGRSPPQHTLSGLRSRVQLQLWIMP